MIHVPVPLQKFIDDGARAIGLPSVFQYDADDPYAVTIVIGIPGEEKPWTLARDLLAEGLVRAAGDGDVALRPCRGGVLEISLYSPAGEALLYADTQSVATFLTLTYAAVPRGHELDGIDVGAELARVFGEAA